MIRPPNSAKRIAEISDRIARAESRMQKLKAKSDFEPGTSRLVHTLRNTIRKYRRELQRALGTAKQQIQLGRQQEQLQQAQREAPPDRSRQLPERQDQEPRKPASKQGVIAGQ